MTSDRTASAQSPNSAAEYRADIETLESRRNSKDLDAIEQLIDRTSAKWKARERTSYVEYTYAACSLLSSYSLGDRTRQLLLLTNLVRPILSAADNLSLKDEARFVEFLTSDPLDLDPARWRQLRLEKARLWLHAWRRVTSSVMPRFDFDDLPSLNVAPPRSTGLPAGVSPDAVKDPQLRAQYEKAINDNRLKAERYNEQYWLKQNSAAFLRHAEQYLISAYTRPPGDASELRQLLNDYKVDAQMVDRILMSIQ